MVEIKKLFFLIFFSFLFAHDAPYSNDVFKDALDKAKLQAPKSSFDELYSRKYGDFAYYSNKYFYLQDGKYMVFYMCGDHFRSELRFKNIWRVDTNKPKVLEASVKLFPLNQRREFTFLQIHADSTLKDKPTINKPLLRLVWYKKLRGQKGHLWAIIRLNDNLLMKSYQKIDLGKLPNDFFDVKISVVNSRLVVYINGKKKVDVNVDYWNRYYNYFKAGVYLQDRGCAKVLFKKLTIKD